MDYWNYMGSQTQYKSHTTLGQLWEATVTLFTLGLNLWLRDKKKKRAYLKAARQA